MTAQQELPPTVASTWRPRSADWLARAPSAFAGRPDRPLFIGGCPRSGTTLLRVMLDSHPDMAIPHETDFVRPLWWGRRKFGDLSDPANRREIGEWIFREKSDRRGGRIRDDGITKDEAIERIVKAPPTLGSIVEACFRIYADVHGKPRWGDKRPAYNGFIGMLFAMFPDAQYINLVRDPRGNVASQVGMPWDERDVAVPAGIARWEGAVRKTDFFARKLRPDQLLDVRYEDLVSDPHGEMERICAWAGLRAGEELESMVEGREDREFRAQAFQNAAKPVTTSSIERWRERISPAEAALVQRATLPHYQRFGYRLAEDITVAPDGKDEHELAKQRRHSKRMWRKTRTRNVIGRFNDRQPVVAEGHGL